MFLTSLCVSVCLSLCVHQSINKYQVNKCQMSTSPSFPLFFSYPLLVILGFFYSTTEPQHQSSLSLFSLSLLSSLLFSSLLFSHVLNDTLAYSLFLSLFVLFSSFLSKHGHLQTDRLTDLGKSLLLSSYTDHTSHIIDHIFSCLIT